MRILDKSRSLIGSAELGMPPETVPALLEDRPLAVRHGDLRRPDRQRQDHHALRHAARDQPTDTNVMTIEDPVEYVFPAINQIQINEQAGLTFATGLQGRSCARTPT